MLQEEKEAEQMLARKYVPVPILQPKLLGRIGIKTHITNLQSHRPRSAATLNPPLNTIRLRVKGVRPNAFLMYMGQHFKNLIFHLFVHLCHLLLTGCQRFKIRSGYLTPAFSGAQKRAKMLRHPCILGGPQTKGDEIRIGCLTPAFSGAQKRAEMLRHPCILGGPQTRGHNQKSKRTLGATMMPLVSQSMGL